MEVTQTIYVPFYLLFLDVLECSVASFRQSFIPNYHSFFLFRRELIFPFGAKSSWYYVTPASLPLPSLSFPRFSGTGLHPHLGFEVLGI